MVDSSDAGPDVIRVRLRLRRWRLWWRFQLRALRHRRPLRRLRLLREPGESVALAALQLRTGRLLGHGYLRALRVGEELRIGRARLPDRVEPARATTGLVKEQLPLLGALVALIALGIGIDEAARRLGAPFTEALGIHHWLTTTFSLPDAGTVTILLAAVAGGTATILGLVLSISLIAWQATADRYRSTSIVAFLLRERIGASVVRLLALAFAYSLWVIALYQFLPYRPYVSAALALALGTVAVVSLISYRRAGLVGYLPESIANSLSGDMRAALARARRPGSGRSVQDHSRRVVLGDLQIYSDLFGRLAREGDPTDIAASLGQLAAFVLHYSYVKHELDPDSLFFERHEQRLPPSSADIEEHLASEGAMNPTMQIPEHHYLERRLAEALRDLTDGPMAEHPLVSKGLFGLWALPLQISWYQEDHEAVEIFLGELKDLAGHPAMRASPETAEPIMTVPWLLVEAAGNGLSTTAQQILATKPWNGERRLRRLPWAAQEDARLLARMITAEHEVAGRTVTPEPVILTEIEQRRRPRLKEQQKLMCKHALEYCHTQLTMLKPGEAGASIVVRMTIRTILRITHHGLPLPDIQPLASPLLTAIEHLGATEAEDLRLDTARAARVLAASGEWQAAYQMLRITAVASLIARAREGQSNPMHAIEITFDLTYLRAYPDNQAGFGGVPS